VTEDNTPRNQSNPAESRHAAAQNPEQHLQDAHKLSVRIQGRMGPTGNGTWALVREEKGKVKTLAVYEGTHQEAVNRFYRYIHPDKTPAPVSTSRQPMRPRSGPRPTMRRPSR